MAQRPVIRRTTVRTPMADSNSFADLMTRLRGGDQDAASEIFGRFAVQLAAVAVAV